MLLVSFPYDFQHGMTYTVNYWVKQHQPNDCTANGRDLRRTFNTMPNEKLDVIRRDTTDDQLLGENQDSKSGKIRTVEKHLY